MQRSPQFCEIISQNGTALTSLRATVCRVARETVSVVLRSRFDPKKSQKSLVGQALTPAQGNVRG
jgi:hypothetical protein